MDRSPAIIQVGLLAVGVAASTVLALFSGARLGWAADNATPVGSVIYDTGLPPGDEGRALFGNIFVGEILEETRRGELPTSDPDVVIPLVYYSVQVDRAVKGDLKGIVEIRVDDVDEGAGASEYEESRGLKVGRRYLFFAGEILPSGAYGVTPCLGTIAIDDAAQEANLVARFERLIPEAGRADSRAQAEVRNASEALPDQPSYASAEPNSGPSGSQVLITGDNFAPGQVLITWDIKGNGTETVAGDDFAVRERIEVPNEAKPGRHVITVGDGYSPAVEIVYRVTD